MDPPDLKLATNPTSKGGLDAELEMWLEGSSKRTKICDSGQDIGPGGIKIMNAEHSSQKEGIAFLRPCNKREIPQSGGCSLLAQDDACLTLGHTSSAVPLANVNICAPAHDKENDTPGLQSKVDKKHKENRVTALSLALDLNKVHTSNAAEHNPFFPYKMSGQSKITDDSECGSSSTTGPVEEDSEHWRKWREMKQNGFLSTSHETMPAPKPRGRPKKRKDELRKKVFGQKEQAAKVMKVAAPSGLLSGLNPGIINHVRNSKQVYSIIQAIVQSENPESMNHQVFSGQMGQGSKEVSERTKEDSSIRSLTSDQLVSQANTDYSQSFGCRGLTNNISTSEHKLHGVAPSMSKLHAGDGDSLKLQLSSAVTMASEKTSNTSTDNVTQSQDCITSLSFKAASVAAQWLELLQQDI